LPPEVIHASYLGQFEEEKPKFLYEFYNVQNQPFTKDVFGKDYAPTIRELDSIISKNQKFPLLRDMAMSMVLLSYNVMGEYERTIGDGMAYIRQYKEGSAMWRANILYNLAEGRYYHHDYQDAERLYLQIKTDYQGQDLAQFAQGSLGWVFLNEGRWTEAWGLFKDLIDHGVNPTIRSFAVYGSGLAFYNQAKYDSALTFFRFDKNRYEELGWTCALTSELISHNLYWAGFCYDRLKYYGDALDSWKKLVSEYPDSPRTPEAAFRIGNLYFRGEDYRNAVSYLKIVVERYPNSQYSRDATLQTAQSYYNLGEDGEALKYYKLALTIRPGDSLDILPGMDACLYRKSKANGTAAGLEDILADYVKYLPRSEHQPELRYELASRYSNEKNFEKAAVNYQQVVLTYSNSPVAPDAQLHLGYTYDTLKDYTHSIEAYRWFLDNMADHPSAAEAMYRLGLAFMSLAAKINDRNNYRHALQAFEDLPEKYPQSEFASKALEQAEICKQKLR
jgi:outer membrane protein assembly factor BamD (BamD/ComL family)